MAKATVWRDKPHARIYAEWLPLPAWRLMSPAACKLLVAILADYRAGRNGELLWGAREAGKAINQSPASGARALTELEDKGWITVERVGSFARRNRPSLYALTIYPNDQTGEPASRAFENWRPHKPASKSLVRVTQARLASNTHETRQSHPCDTGSVSEGAENGSLGVEELKSFKALSDILSLAAKRAETRA